MHGWARALCAMLGAAILAVMSAAPAGAKELALSFDDAPLPDSSLMTGAARAQAIIDALAGAHVRTVFFVNPGRPTPDGPARLRAYAAAGHDLANHSASHPNLDDLTATDFLADVGAAHAVLVTLPNFRRWFRFPYLNEGFPEEKRDAVRAGLQRLGLTNGYVTINTWDWRLAALLDEAVARGDQIDMDAMRALYVETVVQAADAYDGVAVRFLHRSPRHVVLLHENDLAALFLPDLITALRADGWRIITPDKAYRDRIGRRDPDTLANGQGRVAALARLAGATDDDLHMPRENNETLDALFADRVLHRTALAADAPAASPNQ